MARVLVIGGTLFIGRAMVDQLLARGDDVVIMHRGSGSPYGNRVEEIRCDRNDIAGVKAALQGSKFDVVIDNVFDWERGTTGEQVIAAAMATAVGLRRYIFTSSVAVYHPGGEYSEDVELVSSGVSTSYGAQKADSERALFALGRDQDFPVTTLRPAFVYGPNNPAQREAFFWDRIRSGRPIIIPDDGSATMQWVYSVDVARAAILASENDAAVGRAYNLASYPAITQVEFVRLLATVAGVHSPELIHIPREKLQRLGGQVFVPPLYFGEYLDVPDITVRSERVRLELGFEFTPLEAGLEETFHWYRGQNRAAQDFTWEDKAIDSAGHL